jgi:SSS family solute:Na+ symporter
MSIPMLTIIIVVGYLVIIKIVSYFAHRSSSKTVEDYFLTGRTTGAIVLMGTLFATGVNGLAFTAVPALIYEGGILYTQMIVAVGVAGFLQWYFGPKVWTVCKKNNFITQAELFGHYYQSKTIHILTVIITVFSVFPFLIIQFVAVGKIFSVATDNVVTFEQSVLLLAFFTGIYVMFGGARAVVWTDVVQGLIFAIIFIITAYLFTIWAGGFTSGINTLTEVIPEKLVFNSENTPIFIDRVLSWSFAFFLFPQLFQRLMMGRSAKVIRKSVLGYFIIGFPIMFISLTTIAIMATATLYGQIDDRDQLVAEMFFRHWPLGSSMIVLGVVACGMSTIDSILLSLSSIFTRDIVEKTFPQSNNSETSRYRLAQGISVAILIVVSVLALSEMGRGYLAPLFTFGATFATFLLWPFLGMFFWKGSTKIGIIVTMGIAFFTFCLITVTGPLLVFSIPIGRATTVFFVSLLSFVIISLLSRRGT